MKKYNVLFEFLCSLIDIQIEKYTSLAAWGVGPDARINARLVRDEVQELLQLAENLHTISCDLKSHDRDRIFVLIFNQVRFYVEQELVRAQAGWLLDSNNIHSPSLERVLEQLTELTHIAESAKIDISSEAMPQSSTQEQCKHDSAAIAFFILDCAVKITQNPQMELDSSIPEHAAKIIRRNAGTRYLEPKIAEDIVECHAKYKAFLETSPLIKTSNELLGEEAKEMATCHRTVLETLFEQYNTLNPEAEGYKKYKIGASPSIRPQADSASGVGFFQGIAVAGVAVAGYMLIQYFRKQAEVMQDASFAP